MDGVVVERGSSSLYEDEGGGTGFYMSAPTGKTSSRAIRGQ